MGIAFYFSNTALSWADMYGFQGDDGKWHFTRIRPENTNKYESIIQQASSAFGVEASLIKAVIKAESDYQDDAVSRKGAQGLMQLMPFTASNMNVTDPFNPKENIFGGTRYLGELLKRFDNNKTLAIAAYNAGPEMVETFYGVPPFQETRTFVRKVMTYYKRYLSMKE
ncbi:MAG: lytic transglycosylase domain-containing protein [Deltaproteobacteria bacterium]|nr:lytic transglycosylase domain-containing protein [Deltaproteobacteria bacterium]